MRPLNKFVWYGAAVSLPLMAQTTMVGGILAPAAGASFYLGLSLLITMMQVGQAAAFQVLFSRSTASHINSRHAPFFYVALAGALCAAAISSRDYVNAAALTSAGLLIGASFSVGSGYLLQKGGEARYFRRLFLRNAAVLVLAYLIFHLFGAAGVSSLVVGMCVFAVVAVGQISRIEKGGMTGSTALGSREYTAMLFGVLASALYRNDQNLLRFFVGARDDFESFHNALLVGAAAQSIVGAMMTTVALPAIRSRSLSSRKLWVIDATQAAVCAVIIVLAIAFVVAGCDIAGLLAACMVLALNQWWSFRLHALGRSVFVYVSGSLSFFVLLGLLALTRNPSLSFTVYSGTLAIVLGCTTWMLGNETRT